MKKIALSLILIAGFYFTNCKKSNSTTSNNQDTNTTSSTDNNLAEQNSNDAVNIGSESLDHGSLTTYKLKEGENSVLSPMSGSVTISPDTVNKKVTVTFNTFIGYDGHLRNGTLVYSWAGSAPSARWYRDSGLVLNISTPGNTYSVDNYTVAINTKTIKNLGRVTAGNLTWNDNTNITILKPSSGGSILWQCNRNAVLLNTNSYTFTSPDGTSSNTTYAAAFHGYGGGPLNFINWDKAILSFTGTFSGTASNGETYSGNVSSPLILNFNCTPPYTRYLYVSGVLNFTPTGKATRTINYGNGICDLTFNLSIGTWSVAITI
ncbi:MAG: hypothetical protein JSU07_07400 [Bacteroidetes bacterium]|nr:hypothetical protein [Bacteroidota bacterium]